METPKPVLYRPDPQRILTDEARVSLRSLYEGGMPAKALAERFGIAVAYVYKLASKGKWATPGRILRAKPNAGQTDDVAEVVADVWLNRKNEAREARFQGMSKAMQRFMAMAPVPQSFAEAAICAKLLDSAVDPESQRESQAGNVNIAFLAGGFTPRPYGD